VARNWDQHYADPTYVDSGADPLLIQAAEMLPPGRALDLACGPGRHALYLARLGWRVTAVDASPVAIALLRAQASGLPLEACLADLERGEFVIAPNTYQLICDFLYLQRNLFPQIRDGVHPGGVFAAAIHLFEAGCQATPRNPDFLLQPGELRSLFDGWKVLFYSEGGDRAAPAAPPALLPAAPELVFQGPQFGDVFHVGRRQQVPCLQPLIQLARLPIFVRGAVPPPLLLRGRALERCPVRQCGGEVLAGFRQVPDRPPVRPRPVGQLLIQRDGMLQFRERAVKIAFFIQRRSDAGETAGHRRRRPLIVGVRRSGHFP